MGAAELAKTNAELLRNYIRNYQQVRGLVPYVIGRYTIVAVRELGPGDVFPSGMAALTAAVDSGELLMEHAPLGAHAFGERRLVGAIDRFLDHHRDR